MHKPTSVSIIVPTCNRPAELRRCLHALAPQLEGLSNVEVLVCDDSADAQTRDVIDAEFPSFQWVSGPRLGPAANRNRGASRALGDWLFFLDDDCVPDGEYVESYLLRIGSGTSDKLVLFQGPTIREKLPPSLLWESPHNPDGIHRISANFAISQKSFYEVGGFDERFPSPAFEDTEFFSRFECQGGCVEFAHGAIVVHPLRRLPSPWKLAARWEGKVLIAFDRGASVLSVLWRLPWHVLRVIQSRFRFQRMDLDNSKAAWQFFLEWLIVVGMTPCWVLKWSRQPRSDFWTNYTNRHGGIPKHGF